MSQLTRRDFFVRGSQVAIGTAVGFVALEALTGSQPAEGRGVQLAPMGQGAPATATPAASGTPAPTATPTRDPTGWPWKYVKLDPQVVAQKAYDSYYQGGCMFGAFNGIIVALRETFGAPYTMVPTMMSRYGEGGGVGWATLCGALNGSALAINLVLKDYAPVVNDLFDWYTKTAFPTFKPATPKVVISATSVSNSPLCHVSVTEWCQAAKVKTESPDRSERCGRLTADVAAQAVQLLNDYVDGKFKAAYVVNQSVQTCGVCHLKGGVIEDARGKMDCVQCHEPVSLPTAHPK
ncbi:MAG: C_GCAxxG_C_C family protein [Chloroflexi bacterium]|nr:C_GCAxxG_C_C family protein [Chloroflexota bacterium]